MITFISFMIGGCSKRDSPQENSQLIGTWNIRLEEIPDEYTHALTLTNTSWHIVENGTQNRGSWKLDGDTLILQNFTRIHEYINGQLHIGDKAMKYIISNKEENHFEAIPFFEKDVDSFVTFIFERE